MNTATYLPARDEFRVDFCSRQHLIWQDLPKLSLGLDNEGRVCALTIRSYTEEQHAFHQDLRTIRLGGLLKGIRISQRDIKIARRELLRTLEAKW